MLSLSDAEMYVRIGQSIDRRQECVDMDQKWDMEILSVEKFAERYEELFHRSFESSKLHYIRFCKAENWSQAVEGTFAIPQKNIYEEKKQHLDTVYYRTDLFLLSTRQR